MKVSERYGKASYSFFENRGCEYFPCHPDLNGPFNCLFCFCPMYIFSCEKTGTPRYIESGKRLIKDCSSCIFPHQPENYQKIIFSLKNASGNGGPCK